DATGQHVWSQQFGPEGLQYGSRIAVDGAGDVTLGGKYLEGITIGPDSYVNTWPNANEEVDDTLYDGFLIHLDGAGALQSSMQIGTKLDDAVIDLKFDSDGVLLMTAFTDESVVVQAFVDGKPGWKWSTSALQWSSTAVTTNAVVLGASIGVEIDLGGGVLAARGDEDMIIAKILR
ncbi:MAG TPA: hypothetical protein VGB85_24765, partial [Nannocystis sp.]